MFMLCKCPVVPNPFYLDTLPTYTMIRAWCLNSALGKFVRIQSNDNTYIIDKYTNNILT